ncbi:MAG: pilus (MSHA type) biogenesis protein MshL [Magnetococcales bacterium]|nr:pilus (MSHA type) biogenesis protein MshL [Magnetococcales bacterium]
MKNHFVQYGVGAALVLMAGCQSAPVPPVYQGEQETEVERDVKHLTAEAPSRRVSSTMAEMNRDIEVYRDTVIPDMEARRAARPEAVPVIPEYNPLDDIMVSLEMDREDVRQILQALAKMTNMNLMIHPKVVEKPPLISVSFRNMSASTVFRSILQLADLHGQIEENMLKVDPYDEATIPLDFLEVERSSDFAMGGDVLGKAMEGGASGGGGGSSGGSGDLKGSVSLQGKSSAGNNPYAQIEKVIEGVLPKGAAAEGGDGPQFSVNRMAGTLYIKAKPSVIKTVRKLVQQQKEALSRQVLIEARIIEVKLNDNYQTGIDWNVLRRGSTLVGMASALRSVNKALVMSVKDGINGSNLTLDLFKQFGAISVLSNPSIRTRNGQPAIVSVGTSRRYVSGSTSTPTGRTINGVAETTSTYQTSQAFDGLVIGVVPFVDSKGDITLSVQPVKSKIQPGSTELDARVNLAFPVIELEEMSTVLHVRDNDVIFMGGLINRDKSNDRTGIPLLSEIPLLGRLFTNNVDTGETRELVLMLRVNVL